jgi:hypothetical protein
MGIGGGMSELGTQAGGPSSTVGRAEPQIARLALVKPADGRGILSGAMSQENVSLVRDLDNHGAVGGSAGPKRP